MADNHNKQFSPAELRAAWKGIEAANPGLRIRDAASRLNVSEAQLLATQVGNGVIRLNENWTDLLKRLPELGRVMSLTRNDACVLEHKGTFEKVNVISRGTHHMATVIGPIESRVFLSGWHVAFAVKTEKNGSELVSLQIFDHEGTAVTKIYLQDDSNFEAFERLVNDFISDDQQDIQEVAPYAAAEYSDSPDIASLLADWQSLKDTHDFFPMLNKHKISRYKAVRAAEGRFTNSFDISQLLPMLESASDTKLPIMIFAGNRGNLQIHQDIIRTIRVLERGDQVWLNVLDPEFNMHLRTDLLKDAWVVNKPTRDGLVTSVECYDADMELVVQFFGLRKPGRPEMKEWRTLIDSLGSAPVEA
jgi:putative hemin transport protein